MDLKVENRDDANEEFKEDDFGIRVDPNQKSLHDQCIEETCAEIDQNLTE